MNNYRLNSLDTVQINDWRWMPFLEIFIEEFSQLALDPYPIPLEFLDKKAILNSKINNSIVSTSTWACKTNKFRQARVACVEAKNIASVFNLVVSPWSKFDLPFLGADFVTLPNGHLLALDLQPALKSDEKHTQEVWNRLLPIYQKWKKLLPHGGPIPKEAEPYFSPCFLWTRVPIGDEGNELISKVLKPAFREYLLLFLDLAIHSNEVNQERSLRILQGQRDYMKYRIEKDPARGMLTRFYGSEWTENYIRKVLFNL
tara:strand:+ start:134 stop:907 length:774 start_codon:yes stop_codon:yes gene_type:complete